MGCLKKGGDSQEKNVKTIKYEQDVRQPWPRIKITAYRKNANSRALVAFELCLGTDQRISDLLTMKWGYIENDGIKVKQGKTRKQLWVPISNHFRIALASAPRQSVFILTNQAATKLGHNQTHRKLYRTLGRHQGRYMRHSQLRYSAASESLLLAGAFDDLIAAVRGYLTTMVHNCKKPFNKGQ